MLCSSRTLGEKRSGGTSLPAHAHVPMIPPQKFEAPPESLLPFYCFILQVYPLALLLERGLSCNVLTFISLSLGFVVRKGIIL